jgi:hypothetical protein
LRTTSHATHMLVLYRWVSLPLSIQAERSWYRTTTTLTLKATMTGRCVKSPNGGDDSRSIVRRVGRSRYENKLRAISSCYSVRAYSTPADITFGENHLEATRMSGCASISFPHIVRPLPDLQQGADGGRCCSTSKDA